MTRPQTIDIPRRLLHYAVDGLILAILFAAPLFMGGRHGFGKLVYVALVGSLVITWMLSELIGEKPRWRWTGVEYLVALGLLLVTIQFLPLPEPCVRLLAPHLHEDLPMWGRGGDEGFPAWNRISVAPSETRRGLITFLAHGMLFLIVFQKLGSLVEIQRLLRLVSVAVVSMAVLGLVQYLTSNGRFMWIYQHPSRDTFDAVRGTFSNPNHFAHFLAVGLGPLIAWLAHAFPPLDVERVAGRFERNRAARPHPSKLLLSLAVALVSLAGLLSFSRGGVLIMLLVSATTVTLLLRLSVLGRYSVIALVGAGSLIIVTLLIHGMDPLRNEMRTIPQSIKFVRLVSNQREDGLRQTAFESVNSERTKNISIAKAGDAGRIDARRKIWAADMDAVSDYPILGTGVGSHREVYPKYFPHASQVEFTHAESGILQVLLETGIVGCALLAVGIATAIVWCIRAVFFSPTLPIAVCGVAAMAGILASVIHSVFDFVWYIPACMSLTVMLLACACRLSQLRPIADGSRSTFLEPAVVRRPVWFAILAITLLICFFMIGQSAGPGYAAIHWDRYLRASLAANELAETMIGTRYRNPARPEHDRKMSILTDRMYEHLSRTLASDPNSARAHMRMAGICLRKFERVQWRSKNAMNLSQIHEAARASRFKTIERQNGWLSAAVGDSRRYLERALWHARRAVRLCPFQGTAYIYLADLAFLRLHSDEHRTSLVDQALVVRPHDGVVLFGAGQKAALAGDFVKAVEYWRRAFHQDIEQKENIIAVLVPRLPASAFVSLFSPRIRGLRLLYDRYEFFDLHEEAQVVGLSLASQFENRARRNIGRTAAMYWRQAFAIHERLGNLRQAARCLKFAVDHIPNDTAVRLQLAVVLMRLEEYQSAHEQLVLCARRDPNDPRVHNQLKRARRHLQSADRRQAIVPGATRR